jgi:tetratricopeptide (TPR) repeat protein
MKKSVLTLLFFLFSIPLALTQSAYSKLCYDGIQKEENNDLVGAKIIYTQAISLKPEEATAYLFRGKVSFRLKEYDDVIVDLTKVLALQPRNTEALSVRARAYIQNGDLIKAIDDQTNLLNILSKKEPLYTKTLLLRAKTYYQAGKYAESAADLTSHITTALLSVSPVEADVHHDRALAYFKLGKYADAITDLQVYTAKYPNDRSALYLMGLSYYQKGDKENARKTAEKFLEIDPVKKLVYTQEKLLEIFEYIANKDAYTKEYEDIKRQMLEASAIPSMMLRRLEYEQLYIQGKNIWNKIVQPFPDDVMLSDSLCVTLKSLYAGLSEKPAISEEARKLVVQANSAVGEKHYDEAIFLYLKSLNIEPCNHLAYYNLALLYAQKEWYPSAIKEMEEYIKLYPDAQDVRAAQDKIYEWEGKINDSPAAGEVDPELVNVMKEHKTAEAFFIASYGFAKPLGNASLFNPVESVEDRFFGSGNLGMQNGFYVEMGGGGGNFSNKKRMGITLEILLRYQHHKLDWTSAGGMFANKLNYTKDFRFFEVSEKLGTWFRPAINTFIHLYYSPALVMQFETEFREETDLYARIYQIGGSPVRMAQRLGATLRYRFLALSYEWHFVPFKFDLRDYYNDKLSGIITDEITTNKTKLTFSTLRLSFYLGPEK